MFEAAQALLYPEIAGLFEQGWSIAGVDHETDLARQFGQAIKAGDPTPWPLPYLAGRDQAVRLLTKAVEVARV